ncbi:long-chain-fatty-acid-CoA-ligase [Coprinopsis cinerea okayama7|uniref:Long-chain-fatty-acid-CoA-ligase n=1 Tax=Coprinopsis cinerea (strain Okayama-7 / 130 / ATCC MYA-4618 / FGSC 9003) TaxID=240176 RepID=A8NI28_COPC7|nr:long-chain-fatty-acid-CoA-ligase [Coprinopsis cinerea okayama7\|eukprot:XP_001833891.1 long-chain-fatty-acid-CoA-ligase [Coprinopsis cinerea okayama7\
MSKVKTLKPGYYGEGSYEVSPPAGPGEGGVRRCTLAKDGLVERPLEGINTVYDIVDYAARTHGSKKALGWREVVKIVEEEKEVTKVVEGKEVKEKKVWKYFELSDYKFHSYIEVKEIVSEIARALVHLGVSDKDIFNVYAQTSPNWQLMAHACASISTTIATAYDTLGVEGLTHSLNEPECVGLFTNAELLPTLYRVLPNTPTVKYIVFDGEPTQKLIDDIHAVRESIQVFSISQLRELGKDKPVEPLEARRPKPDTIACIMYTSGSTGNPKGVIIKHSNLVASVGAVRSLLGHHLSYDDAFLAYLPLAHVLEYIVELIMLFVGVPAGYGRVKTLTDASVRNCQGDISAFKPTIMVGVPAVWETIRKGILAKVHAGGALKKSVFNGAMNAKKKNIPVLASLADSVVLSGVRAATGGRLRLALSGGAAISRETQEFLTTALVTVLQGYGMTETCGMCAILPPELMRYDSVGLPVPSAEVKLLDAPDAGYLSTNNPPQGEVCIRGPSVTPGYYKRPDLNSDETVFKDGWLRTGDIGQWNPDGTLSLIDRLKNLIKLASGEYIALERLEAIYKSCNLVANICVHAVPAAQQPMAIIIPHEAHLRNTLSAKGLDSTAELGVLCARDEVRDLILKECNAVGKKNGFKQPELLQAVVLTPDEWTPESGLVTAAQKIQRAKISKHFREEISAVYKV